MTTMTRRQCLFMTMGGLTALGGESLAADAALAAVRRTAKALGTKVSITALHTDAAVAQRAVGRAFAELDLIEDVMSLYRPQSQLCRLNRDGALDDPHRHLVAVLRQAAATSRQTGGAFDVTVQPLWRLHAEAHEAGRRPDAEALEAARRNVDWRGVEVNESRVRLLRPGMAVTLNGIAQGFAADRVMAVLKDHGVRHALIDTGELGALGGKSGDRPWKVGIQHPRDADAYVSLAQLKDRCLATSGDYATTFSADRGDHHIFNPRTGRSPGELASVSVAAPTAMLADALSTAVFVLGAAQGLRLIEATPGADALLVLKDGDVSFTNRFPVAG